jgi:hypothetical protein
MSLIKPQTETYSNSDSSEETKFEPETNITNPVRHHHREAFDLLDNIDLHIARPPTPPKIDLGDGKFEFIEDKHSRYLLINAFEAITETEAWYFVSLERESFMFDNSPKIYDIMNAMERCSYPPGHSGSSFGWTMRQMQFLANHGIQKYKLFVDN